MRLVRVEMARAVLFLGEVFGMRLAEALEQAEVTRAVAQRNLLGAHPQSYPGKTLHQRPLGVVLDFSEPVGPSPVVPLAHGEVGCDGPVNVGYDNPLRLRNDRSKLAGEVEANTGVILEERIYGERRRPFKRNLETRRAERVLLFVVAPSQIDAVRGGLYEERVTRLRVHVDPGLARQMRVAKYDGSPARRLLGYRHCRTQCLRKEVCKLLGGEPYGGRRLLLYDHVNLARP